MITLSTRAEIENFRVVIGRHLGLQFEDGKLDFLADVLRQRLEARGGACAGYLEQLNARPQDELQILASCLTVSETYFFRNSNQFRAFIEIALPERIGSTGRARRLRLLSAGCASGEEAYSMGIMLRDHFPEIGPGNVDIEGVDLNPAMIAKARRGRYTAWSLRETPVEVRARHFQTEGSEFLLDREMVDLVSFQQGNLVDGAVLERREPFDVIFCRNVIMYLLPEAMQAVMGHLTRALAPGGLLFLGHAETLRGLSHDFHLCHTHETFYYRKREVVARAAISAPARIDRSSSPAGDSRSPLRDGRESSVGVTPAQPEPSASGMAGVAWVELIRAASERIQHLAYGCDRPSVPAMIDPAPTSASPRGRSPSSPALESVLELLRQEKFTHALQALGALPDRMARDSDTRLLHAVLLTHCGDLVAAEQICQQLLASDDLSAGAHYLMALCREHSGELEGAAAQDRLAIHLDPGFAMAHFHLGLLAQRAGDLTAAREALRQAATLLPREEASRILLFGGGFSRDALLAFTQRQLRSCGGAL